MVNLDPPAGVSRPVFRVNFGDGREELTSDRLIDHKYSRVGHYDVYAWIESEATPPRPVPRVSLAIAPDSAQVGTPVTFNAQLTGAYPGIKYRFVFGDNKQTGWQDQPQTTHSYELANTYLAYVDIGAGDNGSFKSLGGSARQPVRVNDPQRDSVNLTPDPSTVEAGRRVTFNARAISRDPNISYRFFFGDGSTTEWQTSSQTAHNYSSPNTYLAYVQMSSSSNTFGRPIVSSARVPIRVTTSQGLAVNLTVDPATVDTKTLVALTARASSNNTIIRYRFFYGDGSSSGWQVGPRSSHRYRVADTYSAYVEAGLFNNGRSIQLGAASKPIQIAVTPIAPPAPTPSPTPTPASSPTPSPGSSPSSSPSGSPSSSPGGSSSSSPVPPRSVTEPSPPPGFLDNFERNWWKYLSVALLISFVGYQTFKTIFAPRPTFRSVPDAGGAGVDEETNPLAINAQILLHPDIADGLFRVSATEPNLVRSIRREND